MEVQTEKERRIPQTAKILAVLKEKAYVTNVELNRICFRYSARILELRKEGHNIQREYIKPGVYKYFLVQPQYMTPEDFKQLSLGDSYD